MHPETAVRQLEYAVASKLEDDTWGHWEATVYADVFEHVAERGTSADVAEVVGHISEKVSDGYRPNPADVKAHADSLLTAGGRPITDGGEE
ncbi:hypothetical protein SAMN04487949_1476 [Halogranum gelatinilyticum]|uniref:Uncharacterized protein n=1 Tax=Halogranum gelatinilyticum TaxID=660521 RepID=A0A1G9SSC6_9EURY|nr:hypothetical protein [Halogranum gelatinilyticum]SDM38332.1 hypothetical protein SAMN04487949_1476 [Halogranum gelatinilyticum]